MLERVTRSHHLNTTQGASAQWEDVKGLLRPSSVTEWPQPKAADTNLSPASPLCYNSMNICVTRLATHTELLYQETFVANTGQTTEQYHNLLTKEFQENLCGQTTELSRSRGRLPARLQQQLHGCQHPAGRWQGKVRAAHTWGLSVQPMHQLELQHFTSQLLPDSKLLMNTHTHTAESKSLRCQSFITNVKTTPNITYYRTTYNPFSGIPLKSNTFVFAFISCFFLNRGNDLKETSTI